MSLKVFNILSASSKRVSGKLGGGWAWVQLGKIKCGVSCQLVRCQTPLLILRSVANFRFCWSSIDVSTFVGGVAYNGCGYEM